MRKAIMSDTTPSGDNNGFDSVADPDALQPLRDGDATSTADPADDPAQVEWDRTTLADEGVATDADTATGADPAEIPDDADEVPRDDLVPEEAQPETQGESPFEAELGDEGQGDLAPEDL